jgi:isopentenyl-diphosphate delta-isomerase
MMHDENMQRSRQDNNNAVNASKDYVEVIKSRKLEGLTIPLRENVQARDTSTFLEYVMLIHNALPELDIDDIDTSTTFLNHRFSAPIIIDSMTGGTPEASIINARLAEVAEELNLGMGLGSQRAGLISDAYNLSS